MRTTTHSQDRWRALRHPAILATLLLTLAAALALAGCGGESTHKTTGVEVLAAESFLADIAQNVAGERSKVTSLIPVGADPHAYEPTPEDIARIASADLLIVNGGGLESSLTETMKNAAEKTKLVEASSGLHSRPVPAHAEHEGAKHAHGDVDPHFWLDPTLVESYVTTIRDALIELDPEGAETYKANASRSINSLRELDTWIEKRVATIPPKQRILITNHESAGYFADRYGFTIAGTVIPSVGTGETPSAKQLSALTTTIRTSGAKAIFVESDGNPKLAEQIGEEVGVKVITDLRGHSLTDADGVAPTYIAMMKHYTDVIVRALQ